MAVKIIGNAAYSGCLAGIMDGRWSTGNTVTSFASQCAIALAFKTQFLAANAALAVPMTDADNTEIGFLVYGCAASAMQGRGQNAVTPGVAPVATDYAIPANAAANLAKEAIANLT